MLCWVRTAKRSPRHAVMQSAAKHPPMRDPVAACSVCASIAHDLAQGIPRMLGMTDAGEVRTAKHSLRRAIMQCRTKNSLCCTVMQSAAKHPPGRDRDAVISTATSSRHDLARGIPRRLGMTYARWLLSCRAKRRIPQGVIALGRRFTRCILSSMILHRGFLAGSE